MGLITQNHLDCPPEMIGSWWDCYFFVLSGFNEDQSGDSERQRKREREELWGGATQLQMGYNYTPINYRYITYKP